MKNWGLGRAGLSPSLRWPISATTKLTFPRRNLLSHGKGLHGQGTGTEYQESREMAMVYDDNVNEDEDTEAEVLRKYFR